MRKLLLVGVIVVMFGGIVVARQATTQPAAKPPEKRDVDENDFVISPLRVQDMRGITYLYGTMETTLAEMGEPIRTTMEAFEQGIRAGEVPVEGPPLFIYHGVTQDPTKKFTLEIGFPVRADAKEVGEFKLKTLEPFHCATVLYSGPITSVGRAYQQAFADLMGAGMQPTGEVREYYLLWEGMESVNNVTLIQVGVN
jgi:effector-binding domain-containing protein